LQLQASGECPAWPKIEQTKGCMNCLLIGTEQGLLLLLAQQELLLETNCYNKDYNCKTHKQQMKFSCYE
jgi:hypothetical protein